MEAAQGAIDKDFGAGLKALARAGHKGRAVEARAKFLVFDGLVALIQPYLLAREQIPAHVDATLDALAGALIGTPAACTRE